MFTGIIQSTAKLNQIVNKNNNYTFVLESNLRLIKKDIGTSIAIDGVCLTLTKIQKQSENKKKLFFNISPETLKISSLQNKGVGTILNLEKSLKFGDEIAGHFLQGHVDDTGKILSVNKNKNSWIFWIKFKSKFKKYLINKGSIAINGVSLTINEIKNSSIRVDIIPHTFDKTNFKFLKKNMDVNLEYDLLMKFLKK
ncbi:MAG: riboflavin synthase [Candidatus Pelagibacter sp.]|nr:riboflavin synthase [Candidatus Pelagibacter sp.]OUV86581.1 MAG: riboflavin synthase [Pelagibacteraceae bacterium TMED136]|tara:strand:+ start:22 stop:612 length:591 start_codon:yes stop_codon:yes gene_type:complete